MASSTKGLLLTLGGAPADVPFNIPPYPGFYYSNVPHPVGDDCDLTVEQAEQAVEETDVLELVDITPDQVEEAAATHVEAQEEGKKALAEAGRSGRAKENPDRVADERAALSPKAGE